MNAKSPSTSKHTPGPWHIGMKPGPIIYGPQGEQVADLRAHLLMPDESAANARLIAAAPELLEALKTMTDEYASSMRNAGVTHYPEALAIVRQARAVIAKAEGGANV